MAEPVVPRPPDQSRPQSAPGTIGASIGRRFSARKHRQMVLQLQNTLKEMDEAPPTDEDPNKIARRRDMILRVLQDVESQGQKAKHQVASAYNQRYVEHVAQREQQETNTLYNAIRKRHESDEHQREFLHVHKRFWHKRNTDDQAHADSSAAHLREMDNQRRNKAADQGARRNAQLDRLDAKREDEKRARQEAMKRQQQHCEDLLKRKADVEAKHRELVESQAELSRMKAARYMANKREKERQRQVVHDKRASNARVYGNVSKVVVTMRPTIEVNPLHIPHEQRLRLQVEKEVRQFQRYHANDGDGGAIREDNFNRKVKRQNRHSTRDTHADELYEKKMKQNRDLKQAHQDKANYVAKLRALRDEYYTKRGNMKQEALVDGRRKADERWEAKLNKARHANYRRWNRRADGVMDQLMEGYAELLEDIDEAELGLSAQSKTLSNANLGGSAGTAQDDLAPSASEGLLRTSSFAMADDDLGQTTSSLKTKRPQTAGESRSVQIVES